MPTQSELISLIGVPREVLEVEYKQWLDLGSSHGKATLARAAIALANHGGGYIVIGFEERDDVLVSVPRPVDIRIITQYLVNGAISRFSDPEFHSELYLVTHSETGVEHPVVLVPGGHSEPVISTRDCEGVILQNRCYIRKPGPRSEEPRSREEWRALLSRCVQSQRENMLDAIRSIVTGRIEVSEPAQSVQEKLEAFAVESRQRWNQLVSGLPPEASSRFPHGYYEIALALEGAEPVSSLSALQDSLVTTSRVKHTGWSTFLQMTTPEWAPYPHDGCVEAWVGRSVAARPSERDPSMCDFWRVSPAGLLYTIRGYTEDGLDGRPAGSFIDVTLPVWRIGEALLYAARLSEQLTGTSRIVILCRYTGLSGRVLSSYNRLRMMMDDRVSRANEITLRGTATPSQVRDNLAEVLLPILTPLYEQFDFFRLSEALVGQEAQRLQQSRC